MPQWLDNVARLLPAQREAEERRQAKLELADRYVAAAETKTANHQYSGALASYNRALCLQREALGEDHILAGRTLHEIGICLLRLGEEEAALVALKEALYIKLAEYGPDDDETLLTKRLISEVMRDEIQKSIEHSKPPPPIEARRNSGTSAESPSSSSDEFGRRKQLVNSSKLHNSAKWEYALGLFGDDDGGQQEQEQKQQHQNQQPRESGRSIGTNKSGYMMPLRDDTVAAYQKQPRRMNNPDRLSEYENYSYDAKEVRRSSDPVSLHEDYHYREFMHQDSGREKNKNLSNSSSTASLVQDNPQNREEEATPKKACEPRLSKEERLARNKEVSAAVDDLEKSIMASLTSFSVGPEGVQISENTDETNRRGSLKHVQLD